MVLPKENIDYFDLNIFKEFMSDLIKLNNKQNENISIEVLESNNFEEDKK